MGGVSFTKALSRSASGDLRFQATSLAGFQIERVLLGVGDDSFAGYLTFEAADCAFDAFIIVNLYLCHSKDLRFRFATEKLTQRAPHVSIRVEAPLAIFVLIATRFADREPGALHTKRHCTDPVLPDQDPNQHLAAYRVTVRGLLPRRSPK